MKVYQLFLDGSKTDFITNNVLDFELEIISDYIDIFNYSISEKELKIMLEKISKLDLYEKIKFKNGYFEFYCFEMSEDDYNRDRNYV